MSATRKMNREEFLRLFDEISQKFNAFIDSVATFDPIYQREVQPRLASINLQGYKDLALRFPFLYHDHVNWAIADINNFRKSFVEWVNYESQAYCKNVEAALLNLREINYLYQPDENCINPCPRLHHRIWFGSMLPDQYQDFIRYFVHYNPYHRIILWIDSGILTESVHNQIKAFCACYSIRLEDIRVHTHLLNFDLIIRELNESITDSNQGVHYARASDLARIGILYQYGGIYADTDTDTKGELHDISLPLGVAINTIGDGQYVTNNVINCSLIGYDFMAGIAGNVILKLAADISYSDYQTYAKSSHLLWYQSKQHGVHMAVTCNFTGSALHHALQCYLPTADITETELETLFISQYHMPSRFHKSWLNSLNKSIDALCATDIQQLKAESEDADLFIAELNQSRLEKFSIPKGYYLYNLFRDSKTAKCLSTKEHPKTQSTNAEPVSSRYFCSAL